jgi:glucose-6-phosphate isomerase
MFKIYDNQNNLIEKNEKYIKACNQLKEKKEKLGFLNLPFELDSIRPTEQRGLFISQNFKALCYVGVGGSALGAQTIHQYSLSSPNFEHTYFFDNVDPSSFQVKLDNLESKYSIGEIHWVIVSKSGSTVETLAQSNFISQAGYFKENNVTVISSPNENPLTSWAQNCDYPILELPLNVGGRFSVLTPVGLLPAIWLGHSAQNYLKGAQWSLEQDHLVSGYVSQIIDSFNNDEWISTFWVYSDRLYTWGLWVQQLWAESLAKSTTIDGQKAPRVSTPNVLKGVSDQHSTLQQVIEGERDKFITILTIEEDMESKTKLSKSLFSNQINMESKSLGELFHAEVMGTVGALNAQNISHVEIKIDSLSEETMGALFMFMELVVGTLGEVLNIDAFNQPGVELSKKMTQSFLNKNKEV